MFIFKIFGKFIGIVLIIVGAANLIALFIAMVTFGAFDASNFPVIEFYNNVVDTGIFPMWANLIFGFFALGIPFFFLLYLGLKILVTNLKSMGKIAKFSLLGLWLLSVGTLIFFGIRQAAEFSTVGSVNVKDEVAITEKSDTLTIKIKTMDLDFHSGKKTLHYVNNNNGFGRMTSIYDENNNEILISDNVVIKVKKNDENIIKLNIRKDSHGNSVLAARERAKQIKYGYELTSNEIFLDEFLTTAPSNKARMQEVTSTIYIPEGKILVFDESTRNHIGWGFTNDKNYSRNHLIGYVWQMGDDGELKCQDCPEEIEEEEDDEDENEKEVIKINREGIKVNIEDEAESFKMKIGEDGIEIKAEEKNNDGV